MDEARGEEATQSGQQQQCILSGGVYLRHRPKESELFKDLPAPPPLQRYYTSPVASVQHAACRRAGVQETISLQDTFLSCKVALLGSHEEKTRFSSPLKQQRERSFLTELSKFTTIEYAHLPVSLIIQHIT